MANSLDRFVNGSIVVVRDGKRVKPAHGEKFTFTKEEIDAADRGQPGLLVKKNDDIDDLAPETTNTQTTGDNGDGTSGGTGTQVKGTADSGNGQADTGAQASGGTTQTQSPAAAGTADTAKRGQPKSDTEGL